MTESRSEKERVPGNCRGLSALICYKASRKSKHATEKEHWLTKGPTSWALDLLTWKSRQRSGCRFLPNRKKEKFLCFVRLLLEAPYVDQVTLVPLHSTSRLQRCRMKSQLKKTTIQRILWWTKQIHRLQAISPWRQQWECLSPQVGNQGPVEGATNGQDTALCISGVRRSSHAVPLLLMMMMMMIR